MGIEQSEKSRGEAILKEQARKESDAQLVKEGARIEVTGAQMEAARQEMEYEQNPKTKELRDALQDLESTQTRNTERHLQALKAEIGHPGADKFDDAYDFAGTAIEFLDKNELEKIVRLAQELGIPQDGKDAPPHMADDIRKLKQEEGKHRAYKIELDQIVAAHENIVKLTGRE